MLSESIHLPKSIKDAENRFIVVLKEQLLKLVKAINELDKKIKEIIEDKSITSQSNTKQISITVNTTNVASVGAYQYCCRSGVVVSLGLNIQVKASAASGGVLVSGFPAPPARIGCILGSPSVPLRCYIDTDGALKLDGASPSSAQWFNGCITYIINS